MRTGNGTISKLIYDDCLYQEMRAPLKRIDAMLADLQAGQGTAGKLLKDPALYDEAQQTAGRDPRTAGGPQRRQRHRGQAAEGRRSSTSSLDELMAKLNSTIDKINSGPGHARAVAGESAALRIAERRHARVSVAGQGHARQSQEIPDHPADPVLIARKQLVVNADDFGFTPDVNQGIVEAHRDGILTATTLMANGEAFDDAVRLARETPSLDIGCHLVLIGGRSLADRQAAARSRVPQLLARWRGARSGAYDELAAQVRRIVDAGIRPTHLDTHKHTHLAPPVLDAVARMGEEFGIPLGAAAFRFSAERAPRRGPASEAARQRRAGPAARPLPPRARAPRLPDHGPLRRLPDHRPLPHRRTGGTARPRFPDGSTELMCHPGRCGEALRHARTRLKESRERELEALVAPEVRQAL